MPDKKISALDAIVTIATDDVLPIVDNSASTTKKISIAQIKSQAPVQSVNGNTGSVSVQETLVSGTNIKTINNESLLGSGNITISGGGGISDGDKGDITVSASGATWTIENGVVSNDKIATAIDAAKLADGSVSNTEFQYLNGVSSAIQTQLDAKQGTLVSGTNIKTINGDSLLGSGDITISGGGGISDGDKGDITVSASGATWTIDNEAVTSSKIAAGIDAVKIGGGSVDNTEFSYLNGVTSSIQNQLNSNVFSSDFTIALAGGKTFGKFVNGSVVPATGKTAREVILLAAQEALTPTVSLTSPTTIQFNQTAISNVLNFSYTINSLGATVASVSLEWRRNNTGSWTVLTTNTALTTFTHTLTDTNFNTQPFNYRYTVTDTSGGTLTVTRDIIPAAYLSPTITKTVGATTRYLGDIASTISGNVTRRSALVDISSYSIEVSVNGGAYTQIHTDAMAAAGGAYSFAHNNVALVNSTSLAYRTKVVDAFTTTTSAVVTISFVYHNALGFNSADTITLAQLEAFGNISLTNSKARTFTGVTASVTNYTYYVYAASAGDLSNVILDGTTPILGAFTKLTDLTGTNLNGADVTYRVYRSNAKGAFTNNSIQFS
jgi:hypothetical protein